MPMTFRLREVWGQSPEQIVAVQVPGSVRHHDGSSWWPYAAAKSADTGPTERLELTAIPYFAWANRGPGEMAVWIARTSAVVTPTPKPTLATTGTVTTSPSRRLPRFINDGEEPASSDDPNFYFDWWPAKGTTAGLTWLYRLLDRKPASLKTPSE